MRPYYSYKSTDRGVALLMDGGKPYSFDGVLWVPPKFNNTSKTIFNLALGYGSIQNRTGGVLNCVGFGARFDVTQWRAGQWTQSNTTYTDDTVDAQNATINDFPMETLTNNDGFIVCATRHFNIICLDIGTASVGGVPVRTIEYSQAGGSWAALTNVYVNPVTSAHYATGENLIAWAIPTDWKPLEAGHGTNIPIGFYGMRFRATTAPGSTAAVANSLSVAQGILDIEGLADNSVYEVNPTGEYEFGGGCDSMVAILSSKAAIQSMVHIEARVI